MEFAYVIFYLLLSVVVSLPIIQLCMKHRASQKILEKKRCKLSLEQEYIDTQKEILKASCSSNLQNRTKTIMHDIECGKVKKHLIVNDSLEYNPIEELQVFSTFIADSPIFQNILTVEEKKFDG